MGFVDMWLTDIGLMLASLSAAATPGLDAAGAALKSVVNDTPVDLVRGAVAGAFVVAAAFLAGFSVFRRSGVSLCALLTVVAAGAMEFAYLGLWSSASGATLVMLQSAFAASVLVFLSAAIGSARSNAVLGSIMFAGALTFVGLGGIHFIGYADLAGLVRMGLSGLGVFAAGLVLVETFRGDQGARLVLPGAVAAIGAPFAAGLLTTEVGLLAPHALFTFGVLAASLIALTDGANAAPAPALSDAPRPMFDDDPQAVSVNPAPDAAGEQAQEAAMRVSENQLAEVLDYTGLAVLDWAPDGAHQTDSFAALVGGATGLSPLSIAALVEDKDRARYEAQVIARGQGDGAFDVTLSLRNGVAARLRGARAADSAGEISRLVMFAEKAPVPTRETPSVLAGASAGEAKKSAKISAADGPDIAEAIAKGRLHAAFQPIVDLEADGAVRGYEALLRSGDKKLAAIGPEKLVAAAEAQGKGGALAMMMMEASATFLSDKLKDGAPADLFVAFNVSFAQIQSKGFVEALAGAVKTMNLPANGLVLELTESQAVNDDARARDIFTRVKKAGAALAFDDFGAGFSSLSNLHKFSFDYLKVDKSFVEKIGEADGDAGKIVRALADLGRDMGMIVIAEGLASRDLADAALRHGCRYGQGYAFGEPVAPPATTADAVAPKTEMATPVAKHAASDRFKGGGALR